MKQFATTILTLAAAAVMAIMPASIAAASSHQDYRYVALGDSVSAGLGLPTSASASAEDELCGRSYQAYPQEIADYYNISVQNVSCSGAKVDEGIYGEQERSDTELQPQLEAVFGSGTPDLMTITAGANDLRWNGFIYKCAEFSCGSEFDDLLARTYLTDLRIELNWTLHRINRLSGDNPPLVALSDYYNPFSNGTCSTMTGITTGEAAWLSDQTEALNDVIEDAADNYWFAAHVPMDFSGHSLCSSDPWVQGNNDPAPFHPTAEGQQAIAQSFLAAFRNY